MDVCCRKKAQAKDDVKIPQLQGYPNVVIAFQGMLGAYSHLAVRTLYPKAKLLPCVDFLETFAAVEDRRADFALIPIESRVGGRVANIHKLLLKSSLYIIGEYCHFVDHCLVAINDAKMSTIKKVYSHTQALRQCHLSLRALSMQPIPFSDTAAAAAYVAKQNTPHKGAIASKLAAKVYGLAILRRNMQDEVDNVTRFVIFSRKHTVCDAGGEQQITSCIFSTRDIPSNLYKALGGFATNGVNIIKLESYLSFFKSNDSASFYIEFLGSPEEDAVKLALEELRFFSSKMRIFGTYVRNRVPSDTPSS